MAPAGDEHHDGAEVADSVEGRDQGPRREPRWRAVDRPSSTTAARRSLDFRKPLLLVRQEQITGLLHSGRGAALSLGAGEEAQTEPRRSALGFQRQRSTAPAIAMPVNDTPAARPGV